MGNYQDLVFYQKARQVAKAIDALIKSWPKTMQTQEISRQMFRSDTSVGANIADGNGRHQGNEYIHYLIIAQGSANETEHWLHTAQDRELGNTERIHDILQSNSEVIRMITSTIQTIRVKQGSKNVREEQIEYITNIELPTND